MTMETSAVRTLDGVIKAIMRNSQSAAAKAALQGTKEYFTSLASVNYGAEIRRELDRRQLHEIFNELRAMLPQLNKRMFAITDLRHLAKIAADLGAVLRPQAFVGREGSLLRGFYVRSGPRGKPLICVNTANHKVAVAAAFWHEIGHHLTSEVFGRNEDRATLNLNTVYHDHLTQIEEIAADLVMALGCYPKTVAKGLFGNSARKCDDRDVDQVLDRVLPHVRFVVGLEFADRFSTTENLHYLAGVIHLAKLRSVLLREYGI
jgi:hypothetical protein